MSKKEVLKSLLVATAVMAACGSAMAEKITFGTEPTYAPFELTNAKGEIVGFDIDIANAICAQNGDECSFKSAAFDSLIPALKFKKYDATISAMDITDARKKQVDFTNPYYDSSASFITLKTTKFEDVKNVGVQNGTTFEQYLTKNNDKNYKLSSYATLQNSILDLENGRLDMIFGDTAVLAEWLKTSDKLNFAGEKVVDPQYFGTGLGIAVNKSSKDLLAKLNNGLAAIKANGKYEEIYNKWFK